MALELEREGDGWEVAMACPRRINLTEDNKKQYDRAWTQQ